MSTKEIGLALVLAAMAFLAFAQGDAGDREWAQWVLGVGLLAIIFGGGR